MLISHKLKIIYIKSRKVAGSSFQKALAEYSEANCITPGKISKGMTTLESDYNKDSIYNHVTATKLKEGIPKDIWNNYLKIVTIRCPYDVYISSYYYRRSIGVLSNGISFMQFVDDVSTFIEDLHHLHNRQSEILVDFIIKFENLDEDISQLERKIDCPGLLATFQNIDRKKNIRPSKTDPYIIYSKYPSAKLIIDERCQKYYDEGNEFFRKYWPAYKTKLEETISKYKEKGDLNESSITENIN